MNELFSNLVFFVSFLQYKYLNILKSIYINLKSTKTLDIKFSFLKNASKLSVYA